MPPDKSLQRVGAAVRRSRHKIGISQEELAARAGLDRTYIGGIERGERNCSILKLILIAKALKVTVAELLRAVDE